MMINKNYPSCRLQLVQKTVLTLNDINIKNSLWPSKKTLLQNFRDKHNKCPMSPLSLINCLRWGGVVL